MLEVWNLFLNPYQYDIVNYVKVTIFKNVFFSTLTCVLVVFKLQEVLRVTSIAMDYRRKFNKDVIIDYICFRKHGHNELDDPFFTNPKMYNAVKGRESIPNLYAESIVV